MLKIVKYCEIANTLFQSKASVIVLQFIFEAGGNIIAAAVSILQEIKAVTKK